MTQIVPAILPHSRHPSPGQRGTCRVCPRDPRIPSKALYQISGGHQNMFVPFVSYFYFSFSGKQNESRVQGGVRQISDAQKAEGGSEAGSGKVGDQKARRRKTKTYKGRPRRQDQLHLGEHPSSPVNNSFRCRTVWIRHYGRRGWRR